MSTGTVVGNASLDAHFLIEDRRHGVVFEGCLQGHLFKLSLGLPTQQVDIDLAFQVDGEHRGVVEDVLLAIHGQRDEAVQVDLEVIG